MWDVLHQLLDGSDFMPRNSSGGWGYGWLWHHNVADLAISGAYLAFALVLVHFIRKRKNVPLQGRFLIFGLFIIACSWSHLLEAMGTQWPAYRLSGLVKLGTAASSWAAVMMLVPLLPRALALRSPEDLEREVAVRTAELTRINAALQVEIAERQRAEQAFQQKEAQLQAMLEHSPAIIFIKDREGRHQFVNRQFELLLQRPREELLGKTDYELLPREVAERARAKDQAVFNAGKALQFEDVLPCEGRPRTYLTVKFPLYDQDGEAYAVCGIATDITERKRIEEEIEAQRRLLDAVLEAAPVGIVVADATGKLVRMNAADERLWGILVPRDDMHRYHDRKGWWADGTDRHGQPVQPHEWVLARALRGEVIPGDVVEIEPFDSPGQRRVIVNTGAPVRDAEGEILGVVLIQSDITDQKRSEAALQESEERFRGTFEQAAVGMAHVAPDGRWLRVNQRLCEILGYSPAEIQTRTFQDVTHPDDLNADLENVRRVLADEIRTYSAEKRYRRKDGSYVWVNLTVSLIREPSGEPKLFIGVVEDVSLRKQAEEALRAAHQQLSLHMENTPLCVVEWDAELRIRRWSGQAESMFGWSASEVMAMEPGEWRFIHDADREAVSQVMAELLDGRQLRNVSSNRNYHKDGSVIECEWHNSALRDREGRLVSILSLGLDVTERNQTQAELVRAHRELECRVAARTAELARSNADLEQFAYVASHDLQEPLRTVAGYTQLLARRYQGQLDLKADKWIHYIVEGAGRMQQLIEDLLAYSRVGTRSDNQQSVECEAVLAEVARNLKALIQDAGATLTHDPLPLVWGDPVQLVQLLQNLIGNAIKFRGELPPAVHVSATKEMGEWLFRIRDNGIGIDPEYAERIFVIFQRLHGRAEYPGTGMGLAICKRIVERHGGRIWVETGAGQGATSCFTLPA